MSLQIVTPPTDVFAALADVKAHLREDSTDQDALITSLIAAAGSVVEARTKKRYRAQTLLWMLDSWFGPHHHHHARCGPFGSSSWRTRILRLPVAPGGDSANIIFGPVSYTDPTQTVQVLDPSYYFVTATGATKALRYTPYTLLPILYPSAEPVQIQFSVVATIIPDVVQHAIKLLVSHWFRNTDAVVPGGSGANVVMPMGVDALLWAEIWA